MKANSKMTAKAKAAKAAKAAADLDAELLNFTARCERIKLQNDQTNMRYAITRYERDSMDATERGEFLWNVFVRVVKDISIEPLAFAGIVRESAKAAHLPF